MEKLDWRDYGGKHYESIFTKFFQSHYLPQKFEFSVEIFRGLFNLSFGARRELNSQRYSYTLIGLLQILLCA